MKQVDINLGELAFQAEAGNPDAQYRMGVLFLLGESVEQDLNAAYLWMARAAAAQHQSALSLMNKLARCRPTPAPIENHSGFSMICYRGTILYSATTLRIRAFFNLAGQRSLVMLTKDRVGKLVAKIRFRPEVEVVDFPARRKEGFQFPEAS